MDLEGTEAKNDWAGEGQQQINQSTDQVRKSLSGIDNLTTGLRREATTPCFTYEDNTYRTPAK
jgi:hypothetical protein